MQRMAREIDEQCKQIEAADACEKKQLIDHCLLVKVQAVEQYLAEKIAGLLLEMDHTELLALLSDNRALMKLIEEALTVLTHHQQKIDVENDCEIKQQHEQVQIEHEEIG